MNWIKRLWRGIGQASLVHWLWTLLPAGGVGAIIGVLSFLEGRPFSIVLLTALATVALVLFLSNEWRRQSLALHHNPKLSNTSSAELASLRTEVAGLLNVKKAIVDDYQRILGIEARLDDRISRAESEIAGHEAALDAYKLSLLAIYHRERLLSLSSKASERAKQLADRLSDGNVLEEGAWNDWRSNMAAWEHDLLEWSRYAVVYLDREPMNEIKKIESSDFEGSWSVSHAQFPDPEGIRHFKTFCIYRRNWENLRKVVHDRVRRQAFEGQQTNYRRRQQ